MKYNIKLPYNETRDIEGEEKILNLLCRNSVELKKSTEPKTLFKDIYIDKYSLDAHCWCEKNGEVVFDIDYPERDIKIQLLHRLTDKKIYKKFDPLLQKLCFKSIEPHIEECFKSVEDEVKIKIHKKMFAEILLAGSQDCPNRCFLFAYCYKLLNPDVELVCGSMGWEGEDGEPHYEWG